MNQNNNNQEQQPKKKGRPKTERTAIMRCTCCGKQKPIEQFGEYLQCKECINASNYKSQDRRRERELDRAIQEELIKPYERDHAKLLLMSCECRHRSCKYDVGIYKDVKCDYPSYYDFFVDCIKKYGLFRAWKWQANRYFHTKNYNDRPVIDRIDEKGDYTMPNIQVLSHLENTAKATHKPIVFCLWERRGLKEVAKGSFDTISDVIKHVEGIYPNMPKKHVKELVNVAIKHGEKEQGQAFEFDNNDKTYLVQIMYIDKQLKFQNQRFKAYEAYEKSLEQDKAI